MIYFIYFLCRILFYLFNYNLFGEIAIGDLFRSFFYGLRFDSYTIAFSNSLFILLSVIPAGFVQKSTYKQFLKWLFIITNSVFILLSCIDFAYYAFTKKRSTFDIIHQTFGGQTDVLKQVPYYIKDFWYVIISFIALIIFMVRFYEKIKSEQNTNDFRYNLKNSAWYFIFINISVFCTIIALRGGFQRVPIQIVDAGLYASPQNVALVLNTPFTVLKSYGDAKLEKINFLPDNEANEKTHTLKHFGGKTLKNENILVLILESFAKEYTCLSNKKSYTPFFDSLMSYSLVFKNGWANGTKSIEGIPAILASMPHLMENPYINSIYCNNIISSFPRVLKSKSYSSHFFHGGINGTMNFDAFAKTAGFDFYYGKNEYPDQNDFDGNWGIWDEPYLQYCAKTIKEIKEPFFASIFTLSSHHPYKVPDKYKNKFTKTDLDIHESIGYADYSLREFFKTAKTMPWYKNTLFVLVADHTSISGDRFFSNTIGQHQIPIVFFKGDNSLKGENYSIMQQIDIMPSVLDYMGYNEPFFAFGQSVFSNNKSPYAVFFDSGNYYLTNDSLFFAFNRFNPTQTIHYKKDSMMQFNIFKANDPAQIQAQNYLQTFAQVYNNCLINNSAFAKR